MFIDASAIVAILGSEEDAGYFIAKIEGCSSTKAYSSITFFEAVIALARKETISRFGENTSTPPEIIEQMQNDVSDFLRVIRAKEVAIGGSTHKRALEAAKTFGRFVGHPAKLNFGDCFSFASATELRLPLLFKGNDFSQTDIEKA
ncbi:type II toxin-antitoxin system VapC family toxin [Pseudochrobactrum asaccharolyticum]|uniref:Ribonuclease VapC n=1 Tax=Pseudochrobactrum asaccharolyticum TaxID=354351 RepID=A0A366DCB9_9HYPH|nr:type II toxin-antitoxin system VapC family toxin [Pseudochrobactrum asaccharolyticum]RBO87701.1 ribonuclease VapC [Pseudochrobactrum asaccharolyticum]